MSCRSAGERLHFGRSEEARLYVCNCNGIRERQARAAIAEGAARPAEIFRRCQAVARCAKCVCDLRRLIQEHESTLAYAAE
jgi:bacterioferritin-associated ferredoxin